MGLPQRAAWNAVSRLVRVTQPLPRYFSSSPAAMLKNQIYSHVRYAGDLQTYILLSASARQPLITLWTASWCPTCAAVEPVVRGAISSGVGSAPSVGSSAATTSNSSTNGVAYCVVQYDAPDVMRAGIGAEYMITTVPTLLSFDGGEAQVATKVTDPERMLDRQWLEEWIWTEARRRGGRGGGGSWGLWFGGWR